MADRRDRGSPQRRGAFSENSFQMMLALTLASLPSAATGFQLGFQLHATPHHVRAARADLHMMAKGFGKAPPPPPPAAKKKSAAAVQRDAAGDQFEAMKASGAPEYMVCVRTVGDKTSEWMAVGGITVPRSNSEAQALSIAIFDNEEALLKGGRACLCSSPCRPSHPRDTLVSPVSQAPFAPIRS